MTPTWYRLWRYGPEARVGMFELADDIGRSRVVYMDGQMTWAVWVCMN